MLPFAQHFSEAIVPKDAPPAAGMLAKAAATSWLRNLPDAEAQLHALAAALGRAPEQLRDELTSSLRVYVAYHWADLEALGVCNFASREQPAGAEAGQRNLRLQRAVHRVQEGIASERFRVQARFRALVLTAQMLGRPQTAAGGGSSQSEPTLAVALQLAWQSGWTCFEEPLRRCLPGLAPPPRIALARTRGPRIVMLTGGMGAGKSTAIRKLLQLERYVVIEADQFKEVSPFFGLMNHHLSSVELKKEVHALSTRAAEALLLQAVKQQSDIVFDSTLSWLPFALQTLEFIRDWEHHHEYVQGSGYDELQAQEEYWHRTPSAPPTPAHTPRPHEQPAANPAVAPAEAEARPAQGTSPATAAGAPPPAAGNGPESRRASAEPGRQPGERRVSSIVRTPSTASTASGGAPSEGGGGSPYAHPRLEPQASRGRPWPGGRDSRAAGARDGRCRATRQPPGETSAALRELGHALGAHLLQPSGTRSWQPDRRGEALDSLAEEGEESADGSRRPSARSVTEGSEMAPLRITAVGRGSVEGGGGLAPRSSVVGGPPMARFAEPGAPHEEPESDGAAWAPRHSRRISLMRQPSASRVSRAARMSRVSRCTAPRRETLSDEEREAGRASARSRSSSCASSEASALPDLSEVSDTTAGSTPGSAALGSTAAEEAHGRKLPLGKKGPCTPGRVSGGAAGGAFADFRPEMLEGDEGDEEQLEGGAYWYDEDEEEEDEGERPTPRPYEVIMVGVMVDVPTAVERGFRRHVLCGRSVPLRPQLRSHRLFARNFGALIPLVDQAILVESLDKNNLKLVAQKSGPAERLQVHDADAWGRMRRQAHSLNENATRPAELYFDED